MTGSPEQGSIAPSHEGISREKTGPAIGLFLGILAVLTVLTSVPATQFSHWPFAAIYMWTPGVSALLTMKMLGIPLSSIGWTWGKSRYIALAVIIPLVYGLLSYGLVWTMGYGGVVNPEFITSARKQLGLPDWDDTIILAVMAVTYSLTWMQLHVMTSLGEEIGWRGFVTPTLLPRFGFLGTSVAVGLLWAVWHLPIFLYGNYNAGADGKGLQFLMFAIQCISVSAIMTWLRVKSGSIWPAVMVHAAHNLYVIDILKSMTIDYDVTPYYAGEFGLFLPIVTLAIAILVTVRARRDDQLAMRPAPTY